MQLKVTAELEVVTYNFSYFVVLVIDLFITEIVGYTLSCFVRWFTYITDIIRTRIVCIREYKRQRI